MQHFQELPVTVIASPVERVGLSALSLASKMRPHVLPSDTHALVESVTNLAVLMDAAITYVDRVLVCASCRAWRPMLACHDSVCARCAEG